MSYIAEDSNTECTKLKKKLTEFHKCTQVFVRAIRRMHHGVKEEHEKIELHKLKDALCQKIFDRHEIAFNKLYVGLEDYSENFIAMKVSYEEFFSNSSKFSAQQKSKVETSFRCLNVQRDIIFLGVFDIITFQLQYASEHFNHEDSKLKGQSIFNVIEIYNKYLLKVKQIPIIQVDSSPIATNNPTTSSMLTPQIKLNSSNTLNPLIEKIPCPFYNTIALQFIPNSVLPVGSRLKRLTASRILQIAGAARSLQVTECVSDLLVSNAKSPQEENGTRLPWKPIIYDITGVLPQVDIFEEAIAKEEDEYKRNQRKLDIALKQEFGDDFPATDYCPGNDIIAKLPPLDINAMELFNESNLKLFELFAKKFLITFGILVATMTKKNKSGKFKIIKTAKARLEGYFIEQMWGTGTEQIEEIVLWTPPPQRPPPFPPPAVMSHLQLFKFLNNFNQYCDRGVLPESCEASCEALVDECRHVAILSFMDIGLVRGFGPYARTVPGFCQLPDNNYCTEGGHSIIDVVEMLVWQINEIERVEPEREGKDWPISELVGFILCLGSLLGSLLSCCRLRASYLLHTWSTAPFFLITQADLPRIIDRLKKLNIQERDNLVKTDDMARLQQVMYREKVVVMIEGMVLSIKAYEQETVDEVSCVCRTVSLAQLQNSMPIPKVWRGIGRIPHEPQDYVYEYIGTVLEPVLEAVTRLGVTLQKRAGSTVLKVVCYAWLEHIRVQKIKFSLWGAQQLLKDFHALAEWLRNYPGLDQEARTQILAVDVLRECEGVARLLMRQPPLVVGYTSNNQVAPLGPITAGRKHDKEVRLSCEDDDIPAEMYVPNQQLWLALRARSASAICVRLASCCSWPY